MSNLGCARRGTARGEDGSKCIPSREVCDGRDNDCNGVVDDVELRDGEGCTLRREGCESRRGGAGCVEMQKRPIEPGPGSHGLRRLDGGGITLDVPNAEGAAPPALWIANADEGTVSKLDPSTGRELARYSSVGRGGLPVGPEAQPSRTAIDGHHDAYVANRAFGGIASVSKIAAHEGHCVDWNGNGVIETSRDRNGDGVISLDRMEGEFFGPEDECLLWTVAVGGSNAIARALAVGPSRFRGESGDVWVGLFSEERALRLASADGQELASVPLPLKPYGAVLGADGRIYFTSGPAGAPHIVALDPDSLRTETIPLPEAGMTTYGIAADGLGRILLTAEWGRRWKGVLAYEPSEKRWWRSSPLPASQGGLALRGVVATEERVWAAGRSASEEAVLFEVNLLDLVFRAAHRLPGAGELVGVGASPDRAIWAIDRQRSRAYRFDPFRLEAQGHPVGRGPYSYSDFSGTTINRVLGHWGELRLFFEGCPLMEWRLVEIDAEIPPQATIFLFARSASPEAIGTTPWQGPFRPPRVVFASPSLVGAFLELSIRMRSASALHLPVIHGVRVVAECIELL
ncbi:MAG: hypothetical protein NZM37_02090 [Sandaracinaceae bacterium]|nr:hypothetical protein [Sandaracinaceae bacterium]